MCRDPRLRIYDQLEKVRMIKGGWNTGNEVCSDHRTRVSRGLHPPKVKHLQG